MNRQHSTAVIGENSAHPLFGDIRIRKKGILYPLDNFGVARREDRSITAATEKPTDKARVGMEILRQVLQLLSQFRSALLIDHNERTVI